MSTAYNRKPKKQPKRRTIDAPRPLHALAPAQGARARNHLRPVWPTDHGRPWTATGEQRIATMKRHREKRRLRKRWRRVGGFVQWLMGAAHEGAH